MSTFRGMDGSVRLGANVIGEINNWSMTTDLELLEDTVMGDTFRSFKGGLASWQGSVAGHLDYGDTLGQKVLIDKVLSGAPDASAITLELRVTATKYFTGSAILFGIQVSAALSQIIPISFNFQGAGALTPTWA